jgi:excisionase family DNA binding protein
MRGLTSVRLVPTERSEMQNGSDAQLLGSLTPMVAELLDHLDQVAALSPGAARRALVEVVGVEQRFVLLIAMLAARLGEDGQAQPISNLPTEQGALTQEDAARAYGMPLRTVRRLTRTRRIPSYLLGRNRMIRAADMDRYLARCRDQHVKVGTSLDG